jgi:hypothetical protein
MYLIMLLIVLIISKIKVVLVNLKCHNLREKLIRLRASLHEGN